MSCFSSKAEPDKLLVVHATNSRYRMSMNSRGRYSDLALIASYLLLVLLIGAILSPPLFFLTQHLMTSSPEGFLAKTLGDKEFSSYFNRAALVGALVGLLPLFKLLKVKSSEILGTQTWRQGLPWMVLAFALASSLLFAMGYGFLLADAYRIKSEPPYSQIFKPLLSAFTVSFLEEYLFRGAILIILCRSLGTRAGLWWTIFFFAFVHFLKPPQDGALPHDAVTWTSGFWIIGQLVRGFGEVDYFLAEFCTLAAVGWALASTRLASNGLWVSIGLHAGWVFGLKYFGQLTRATKDLRSGEWLPWIGTNLKVGLTPLLIVVLTGFIMLFLIKKANLQRKVLASSRS